MDQDEAKRRRKVDRPKPSHPIAAIEKRVIDSEALADCRPSSVVVLLLLARNLDKGRNGHTFVSQEDAARHGVEKKTFYRALIELQTHGFIYPTSRGGHGRCGTYALTWLPLSKDTDGLRLQNFKPCAWRDWMPEQKKKRGGKMPPSRGQKSPQPINLGGRKPPSLGDKNPPLEFNTNTRVLGVGVLGGGFVGVTGFKRVRIPGYLAQLRARKFGVRQRFPIPLKPVLQ